MKTAPPLFFFDPMTLQSMAESLSGAYANAKPFPHIAIDNFFPEEIASILVDELPGSKDIQWAEYSHAHSKKLATNDETQMGEMTRHVLGQMNISHFLLFLEKLSGIEGLIPDTHLWGGGLHQITRGGYLNVHVDFNWYEKLKLNRRLNLLLYLNKDWREEYGGHIELWGADMAKCEKKILPVFNRCVIFSTSDFSYHGHPEPLTCPEGWSRKSLALYYYTRDRHPEDVLKPHSTLYKDLPGVKSKSGFSGMKQALKKRIPPAFLDLWGK